MNANIETTNGCLPLNIIGKNLSNKKIDIKIPSAQIKSGIILAALNTHGVTKIIEHNITRDHTEIMLEAFGADIKITYSENDKIEGERRITHEMSSGEDFAQNDSKGGCAATYPKLNKYDESTKTPGLFLCGPAVRHDSLSFCFVYKFRQRFGVVSDTIARGLGYNTEGAVKDARDMNMFLDDFKCCKSACGETC